MAHLSSDVGILTDEEQSILDQANRDLVGQSTIVLLQLRQLINRKLANLDKGTSRLTLLECAVIKDYRLRKDEAETLLEGVLCKDFWGDFLNEVSDGPEFLAASEIGEAEIALSEVVESVLNEVTKKFKG